MLVDRLDAFSTPIYWIVAERSNLLDYAVYRESVFGGACAVVGLGIGGSGGGMPIALESRIASAIAVLDTAWMT